MSLSEKCDYKRWLFNNHRQKYTIASCGWQTTYVCSRGSFASYRRYIKGVPDPFRCALRGAQEEIGIELDPQEIEFTAFGVHPILCQYSLIGWSRINETKEEIQNLYSLAVPKDKWENRRLYFVPCNPNSIAQFVVEHKDNWFSIGLAAVVLSLFQIGYDKKEIESVFSTKLHSPIL